VFCPSGLDRDHSDHQNFNIMAHVNPYLTFNGNCEEAFLFYKSVFGGDFQRFARFKDMPPMPGEELTEHQKQMIMHVALPTGGDSIILGSDSNPLYGDVKIGQNISLSIIAQSKEEAARIFQGLSAGGHITMPIDDTFWNAYFGMLVDRYGIIWMVNYDYPSKD